MINKKIRCSIYILCLCALAVWIFLNPYSDLISLQKTPEIIFNINNFFSNIGLKYHFVFSDVCKIIRFTEYFIFGILFSAVIGLYFKNIFISLFIGFAIPVSEIYFRCSNGIKLGVDEIVISFVEFSIGIIVYVIFFKICSKSNRKSKYKSYKHERRR